MDRTKINQLSDIVAFAIGSNLEGLIKLLNKYGVDTASISSKRGYAAATIELMTTNKKFAGDLRQMLSEEYTNFSGGYYGMDATSTVPSSSGFDWGNVTNFLNTGASVWSTVETTKAQKELAAASAANKAADLEIAKINAAKDLEIARLDAARASSPATKSSPWVYVGLGVGALVLVAVLAKVVSKK
jgi:hypothetical protein